MESFQALWANNSTQDIDDWKDIHCELRETKITDLTPGEVIIESHYSSLNFKDALAVTGKGKILRKLPLVPGIDVAGVVILSRSPNFKEGDKVIVHGCNTGEVRCGGYSEFVSAPEESVTPLPPGLSLRESMIYGTAGFTAGLALQQMEHNGLTAEKGKVLVTGASGGVGSLALQLLSKRGYSSEAWTRKEGNISWLEKMGATAVVNIQNKDFSTTALSKALWAGAIDNVGGDILSYIIARTSLWGSVASIGLAKSEKLESTVFPFILRGVRLLGISSNNCPQDLRLEIWKRLASDLKPEQMESIITSEVGLADINNMSEKMVRGETHGRTLVRIKK